MVMATVRTGIIKMYSLQMFQRLKNVIPSFIYTVDLLQVEISTNSSIILSLRFEWKGYGPPLACLRFELPRVMHYRNLSVRK